MRPCSVILWLLLLVSCNGPPGSRPVPRQRRILPPVRFDRIGHYVAMNRPNAQMYFLRDISRNLQSGLWRWTGRNPTMRFDVPAVDNLTFTMDFTIPEVELRQTGPLQITFRINDRVVASERYDNSEMQHLSVPVPAALIDSGSETVVSAETDKGWRTRIDGREVELGFILVRAGFEQ